MMYKEYRLRSRSADADPIAIIGPRCHGDAWLERRRGRSPITLLRSSKRAWRAKVDHASKRLAGLNGVRDGEASVRVSGAEASRLQNRLRDALWNRGARSKYARTRHSKFVSELKEFVLLPQRQQPASACG